MKVMIKEDGSRVFIGHIDGERLQLGEEYKIQIFMFTCFILSTN